MEHHFELPAIRPALLHAGRNLLEATIIPLTIFYAALQLLGFQGALVASLAWSYSAVIRRLVRREGLPGILVIGTMLATLRAAVAFATNSVFFFLLQPTLGTFLVAGVILASASLGKPLVKRVAQDFCPLPDKVMELPSVERFFLRISLLWSLVYLVNGVTAVWLLMSSSTGTFLVLKPLTGGLVTAAAAVFTLLWFRRSLHRAGVSTRLRWHPRSEPKPAVLAA